MRWPFLCLLYRNRRWSCVYLLILCAGKQMSLAPIIWTGEVCFRVWTCNHKIPQYKESPYEGITSFLLGCGWKGYSLQLCPLSPGQRPETNIASQVLYFAVCWFKSLGFCMSPLLKGQALSRGWSCAPTPSPQLPGGGTWPQPFCFPQVAALDCVVASEPKGEGKTALILCWEEMSGLVAGEENHKGTCIEGFSLCWALGKAAALCECCGEMQDLALGLGWTSWFLCGHSPQACPGPLGDISSFW